MEQQSKLLINQRFTESIFSVKERELINGMINLAIVAFILALIKSNIAAFILLFISLALVVTTSPMYLISRLLSKQSRGIDALYGYFIYIVTSGIVYFILFGIFIDSQIGGFLEDIGYYL